MNTGKTTMPLANRRHYPDRIVILLLLFMMLTFMFSCRGPIPVIDGYNPPEPVAREDKPPAPVIETPIPRMGHAIQAGAFSRLENAVRLTDSLQKTGLDPYYFKDDSGFYKVRFGNFQSRDLALANAIDLRGKDIIEVFYIVGAEDYLWKKEDAPADNNLLRKEIVKTAKSFIGIPYRFGGETSENGFDCSGLTMASYRLNGLELPRASWQQWTAGRLVARHELLEGDLVFFDTLDKGRVSHVGVYIGNGQFIHAPKTGKTIRIASMSSSYFKKRYLGARTYL
ncbi:MAG: C40 family peptidase [Deltaproteobacteria bacterium]|nr:C40 family peptidase [Deltaproteobacteria bacterium]